MTTPAPGENGCQYFRAVFFHNRGSSLYYQVVQIDTTESILGVHARYKQTERETD